MPKSYLLFFLLLSLSCRKGSNNPTSSTNGCRIATIDQINQGATIYHESYIYDAQNRIVRININDNVGDSTYYTYDYEADKIVQSIKPNSTLLANTSVYYLDNNNRIVKAIEASLPNTEEVHYYNYDATGHLSMEIEIDSGDNNKHIDSATLSFGSNGNLFKILHKEAYIYVPTGSTTLGYYSTSFTQTTDEAPYLAGYESELESFEDIYYHRVISKYLGKGSVNSISTYTQSYNNNYTVTYTYAKDNKGNIIAMTVAGTERTDTYNFSYSCQ